MLETIQTLLNHHVQAFKKSTLLLCRKPWSSLVTMIVVAITLTLPPILWIISSQAEKFTSGWQSNGHMTLYLSQSLTSQEQASLFEKVKSSPGVEDAVLTSPEEGLAELRRQEGMQDIMAYLSDNPLPAVIEVIPSTDLKTPESIEQLFNTLRTYDHVESAQMDVQWMQQLYQLTHLITHGARSLMLLLSLAVMVIIANTLRLTLHTHEDEIQVLKLVGATDAYILRPFLYSGMTYGFIGAMLALAGVNFFLSSVSSAISSFASSYQMHLSLPTFSVISAGMLVMFAISLGWVAARFSVKSQLMAIEPRA